MPKQSGAETLAMRNKIYMTVQESVIGAGTGDYNKLKNVPIINLKGESISKAVNLSGLNPGHFSLSGYYSLYEGSEISYLEDPVDLHSLIEQDPNAVQTDPVRKVLYYIYSKSGHLFIRMIVYVGSTLESDMDICMTKPLIYWDDDESDDGGDDSGGNTGGDDNGGSGGDDSGSGDNTGGDDGGSGGGDQDQNNQDGNDDNNNGNGGEGGG